MQLAWKFLASQLRKRMAYSQMLVALSRAKKDDTDIAFQKVNLYSALRIY